MRRACFHTTQLTIAAFSSLNLMSAAAYAQTQPVPPEQAEFFQGVADLRDGRFQDAVVHFEQSTRIRPEPVALYNLAVALRGAGQLVRAITVFERYALAPSPSATGPMTLLEVRNEIARLRASVITVTLRVSPARAIVAIDGAAPQPAQTVYSLDPGPHTLRVSASGYMTQTQEIPGVPGRAHEFTVNLLAEAQAALLAMQVQQEIAPPEVSLSVHSTEPSAVVLLDGAQVAVGDVTLSVPAGRHTIVVQAAGFHRYQHSIVARSSAIRVDAVLERDNHSPWVIPVTLTSASVLAVGGIVVGIFFATRRGYLYEGAGAGWLGNTTETAGAR